MNWCWEVGGRVQTALGRWERAAPRRPFAACGTGRGGGNWSGARSCRYDDLEPRGRQGDSAAWAASAEKELQRWVDTGTRAGDLLSSAASITVLSDREGDIYEQFVCCPANVHLVVRACQNRAIVTDASGQENSLLFDFIDGLPEQGRFAVTIPAAPGRKARTTELALRFSTVVVRKPLHGVGRKLPNSVTLHVVDVRGPYSRRMGNRSIGVF